MDSVGNTNYDLGFTFEPLTIWVWGLGFGIDDLGLGF